MATYQTRSEWEAAQGGGWTLRAHYDFSSLGSASWLSDTTVGLTPDDGTVTGSVTWTRSNSAQADSWGPNGSTGIDFEPTNSSGDWFNTAAPACMNMRASVADLTGVTPDDQTEILLMSAWTGTLAANYQGRGLALRELNDVFQVREQWDAAAEVRFWRGVNTTWTEVQVSATATWHALWYRGGVGECYYGTGAVPTTAADVLAGTFQSRSFAGTSLGVPAAAAPSLDLSSADVYLYSMQAGSGGALVSVCTDLRVWQNIG